MNVGIIDYHAGNLFSISKIVKDLGYKFSIISNAKDLKSYDKFIMPGVGSFKKAMEVLNSNNFTDEIKDEVIEKKKFFLGICLGMQLMFKKSSEDGLSNGLGFFEQEVLNLKDLGCNLSLPHIGWNNVIILKEHAMMKNISQKADFYFANNFGVSSLDENVISITKYEIDFVSAIAKDNLWGVQFHPEKSSISGRKLIENFLKQ